MKGKQPFEIDVGNAIAVAQHERVAFNVLANPLQTTSGHGAQTSIGESYLEALFRMNAVVADLRFTAKTHGKVVVHGLIVQKIFLDHVAAIAQTKHKFAEAAVRVDLHDVPQNRATADLNHRLGPELSFFAQPSAEPAT